MSNQYYDQGEKAHGQKVALCTTVYDAPSPGYVFSIQRTRQALEKEGIQTAYLLLAGNCHVDDARNSVVQQFLLSDCTDLVFLDADVSWRPDEIIKLCKAPADLVGGIYPYRRQGQADKMPVLTIPGVTEADKNGLLQVAGLPTGFMRISRHVLETLSKDADHYWNKAERRSMVPILFERTFEDGVRWGGDITFCRKWHKAGGQMYAMPELHLSHSGNATLSDSLGAALRRQSKGTMQHMVDRIRHGDINIPMFSEVLKAEGNPYSALEDVLMMSTLLGQKADGPILETGSGITSIAMAASTDQTVYCLEHDQYWADRVIEMAEQTGIKNINVKMCDIEDGWYKRPKDLPSRFSLALNDGPPRIVGDRMKFFDYYGDIDNIVVDDADDKVYGEYLTKWCAENNRKIDFVERSALIRR